MANTTERAIQEDVTINVQLQKMSEKTTELVKEKRDWLRERTKRQLEITESTKEATHKNNNY